MVTSSNRAYATCCVTQVCCSQSPCGGHCWAMPPQETLKCSKAGLSQSPWGLWVRVLRSFFWALQASLAGMGFDFKHDFAHHTILLGCLLCPWTWGIFFRWDRTFSYQRLFGSEVQFRSSHRRWVHILVLCHLVPRRHLLLGRKATTNLDSIWKSRDVTLLTKVHLDKAMFFPVVIMDVTIMLDHKESWVPKNWCFWTVALEKILESPLDCKEIQPVHPKGNQS